MKKITQAPTDYDGLDDAFWTLCIKELESLNEDEVDALPELIATALYGISHTQYADEVEGFDAGFWISCQKEFASLSDDEIGALPKMIGIAFAHVSKIQFIDDTPETKVQRNGDIVRELKAHHKDKCQVCGLTLKLHGDMTYSEGHHIKPIGYGFCGPDIKPNIIIVCPNCHTLLGKWCVVLGDIEGIDKEYIEFNNARVKAKAKDVERRMRRDQIGRRNDCQDLT